MSMSFLWDFMGGDEHVAILLNEFFKGRTIEEIEYQIFSVMDERIDDRADRKINEGFKVYRGSNNLDVEQSFENFERKLNENQLREIKNILKRFDNKLLRDEETQHELQNRLSAIEKYIRTMPESKEFDEADIKNIIQKEIEKFNIPHTEIDENSIADKVAAKFMSAINKELNNYNRKISELDSKISELQNIYIQDQKKLSMLDYSLEKEKERNVELESIIKKDKQERTELFNILKQLQNSVSELKNQKKTVTVCDIPKEEKKSETAPKKILEEQRDNEKTEKINILYSSEDKSFDLVLERFVKNTEELEKNARIVYADSENGEIIFKLINKCRDKFIKLKEKNSLNDYDVEKIVSETAKIIKQTVAKALSQKAIRDYIDEYLRKCGIRKINWQVGKKLDDSDYEYLGETVLYDSVEKKSDDETITGIVQDSYVIDYEEDGEKYEKLISGIYHIGRYGK